MKLRTLIVDDEPLARRRLRRLLRSVPSVEIVGECGDGVAAIEAVDRERPDLLLLDIQMPEIDGFGVLRALPAPRRPVTVFVTAYDSYAIREFEVHALDYLLKPIDESRLMKAVGRAGEQIRLLRQGNAAREPAFGALLGEVQGRRPLPDYYLVRDRGRVVSVRVEEIDWVEARGKYVQIHVGAETHLIRERLGQVEARLDPSRFLRIHRSTLVNVRCIKALEPAFHGDSVVHLRDGTQLTLSRSHRERLSEVFGELG